LATKYTLENDQHRENVIERFFVDNAEKTVRRSGYVVRVDMREDDFKVDIYHPERNKL
jgi:hypothetical protein